MAENNKARKLIVCCDGTWNTPKQEDNGVPSPTNVYKLYRAISDIPEQLTYYHPGIGTEGHAVERILDGAFGSSIGEHIQSAYYWLAENYRQADQIYLFGFSRGAFTVRSLAGMLNSCGLLDFDKLAVQKRRWARVKAAYKAYRQGDLSFWEGKKVAVKFLGVWDTVGALGIPDDAEVLNALFDNKDKWKFHDTALGDHIEIARHAIALDEKRSSFTCTRWSNAGQHKDAKEMWFPGVHSDVGGGYEDSSLSDVALNWMLKEAKEGGLEFKDVGDQIKPNWRGPMHDSYKGVFAVLRSRPRNVPCIEESNTKSLHYSILERQKAQLLNYPEYWPTKRLGIGKSFEIDVYASERWNYTGVYMKQGEKYIFGASGEWVDKSDICDWRGTENDRNYTKGDVVRFAGSLLGKLESLFEGSNRSPDLWMTKRFESADWFSMVGVIANDSGKPRAVGNDGSPSPHSYIELPNHQAGNPVKITSSGYFYAFANDAWHFYKNNKGKIQLKIQRIS